MSSRIGPRRALGAAAGLALVCASLATSVSGATADPASSAAPATKAGTHTVKLTPMGRANLGALARAAERHARIAPATTNPGTEIPPRLLSEGDEAEKGAPPVRIAPDPNNTAVTGKTPGTLPIEGLDVVDSRYADGGNQFTGEPPDQALCTGAGYTMEGVNTAIAVVDRTGAQLAPTVAISDFFGLAHEYNRTKNTFGPFSFDPVCLYDSQIQRFIFLVTELDQDPFTGNLTGGSHLFFAVSATSDPLGTYARYSITTTNGDSTDSGCPCFDDFPHIGTDANGFYITANRFPLFQRGYNGAQLYAISKQGLAANAADPTVAPPGAVSMNVGPVLGRKSYTVQPAAVPSGGQYPNREYFLTTENDQRSRQIGILALSNTASLATATPNLRLTRNAIDSRRYVPEPNAVQKPGRSPLGDLAGEPENSLDSASAMSEVEFAQGRLWAATGTAVGNHGARRDGALWFQVVPSMAKGRVNGTMARQGYLSVKTNNLMYPAVGVNAAGDGAMVMSLAGPTIFPSATYVEMDMSGVHGRVHIARFGKRPDDGFTCYKAFVGSRDRGCRWGDYSAATADEKGRVWMATEWISGRARVPFANWSTEIMRYNPNK